MKYVSTRGEAPHLSFDGALLAGLARDGGLYVPDQWPTLERAEIAGWTGLGFADLATEIVARFAGDAIPRAELARMTRKAYGRFGHTAVTPLVQIGPRRFVLELFHGPTLAFKDVAMLLLAQLMDHALAARDARATIVGATSGDTGGAAIEAFRGSARVDVAILFPEGRVSDVQRRMMTTPTEPNVHTLAIAGTFDDCQARVKDMFNHLAFRDRLHLAGVNSINWARIVAQVTYYFAASLALGATHRRIAFAVPTGNFGDILAAWVARRMGLPIERLVIATNANDILARTHATGRYETRAVAATTSPSMDIQVSSNFERWLFEASGRDAGRIRAMMAGLGQSGAFDLGDLAPRMRTEFAAVAASEKDVAERMRRTRTESGYLADPHTACGLVALDHTPLAPDVVEVVLATAHPAKFPDAVEAITGERPALPPRLAGLFQAPERAAHVPNDLAAIESHIERVARIAPKERA